MKEYESLIFLFHRIHTSKHIEYSEKPPWEALSILNMYYYIYCFLNTEKQITTYSWWKTVQRCTTTFMEILIKNCTNFPCAKPIAKIQQQEASLKICKKCWLKRTTNCVNEHKSFTSLKVRRIRLMFKK